MCSHASVILQVHLSVTYVLIARSGQGPFSFCMIIGTVLPKKVMGFNLNVVIAVAFQRPVSLQPSVRYTVRCPLIIALLWIGLVFAGVAPKTQKLATGIRNII